MNIRYKVWIKYPNSETIIYETPSRSEAQNAVTRCRAKGGKASFGPIFSVT